MQLTSNQRRVVAAIVLTAVFLALGVALYLMQARLVTQLLARYANQDHFLLWQAAADRSGMHLREPASYGDPSGITLEAIPIAILHAFGVAYGTALPAALIAMAAAGWALLALGALRAGLWLPAIVAAVLPLSLRLDHWVVVGTTGVGVGRLLGALTVALALTPTTSRVAAFAIVALAGLSISNDSAASILVIPALVWWGARALRTRELLESALLGALVPAAWRLFNQWFDRIQSDRVWSGPLVELDWAVMAHNMAAPKRWLGPQALQLAQAGGWVVAAAVLLWLIALALKARRELSAASCLLVALAALAMLPGAADAPPSLWSSPARMTLAMPMALWFVFAVTWRVLVDRLEPWLDSKVWRVELAAAAIALAFCGLSVAVRARGWQARIRAIEAAGLADTRRPLRRVEDVVRLCDQAARAAIVAKTQVVVFPFDGAASYACTAIHPALTTFHLTEERRFHQLRAIATEPVDRMLVWGLPADVCRKRRGRSNTTRCRPIKPNALSVEFTPKSPIDVIRALGY